MCESGPIWKQFSARGHQTETLLDYMAANQGNPKKLPDKPLADISTKESGSNAKHLHVAEGEAASQN